MTAAQIHTAPARQGWRAAYTALLNSDDALFFRDHMLPAFEDARPGHQRRMDRIRSAISRRDLTAGGELYELYALSRLHDLLLCHFEPDPPESFTEGWFSQGPTQRITPHDHRRLVTALDLDVLDAPAFCPALHEVVTLIETPDPDSPPEITAHIWPCLSIGAMLFARGGVVLRAGRNTVPATVAGGPLFWAHARRGRRTHDLSDGWGSNSQWSTLPRIDVIEDEAIHLNLGTDKPAFPHSEQDRCLLLHRCPLPDSIPSNDLWPYDLSATYIRRTGALAPLATPFQPETVT